MTDLIPGETVVIIAGRHRGSRGELIAVERVSTPAGGYVFLAVVRRPRAGDTVAFLSDVARPDAIPVPRPERPRSWR